MSYCHLCNGGNKNIEFKFAPKMLNEYIMKAYDNDKQWITKIDPNTKPLDPKNADSGPSITAGTNTGGPNTGDIQLGSPIKDGRDWQYYQDIVLLGSADVFSGGQGYTERTCKQKCIDNQTCITAIFGMGSYCELWSFDAKDYQKKNIDLGEEIGFRSYVFIGSRSNNPTGPKPPTGPKNPTGPKTPTGPQDPQGPNNPTGPSTPDKPKDPNVQCVDGKNWYDRDGNNCDDYFSLKMCHQESKVHHKYHCGRGDEDCADYQGYYASQMCCACKALIEKYPQDHLLTKHQSKDSVNKNNNKPPQLTETRESTSDIYMISTMMLWLLITF